MDKSKTVILFLIDGMRPDGLLKANTPVMDHLIAAGVHTLDARTIMPSVTLPCILSLFLGVTPERHGNTTNVYTPPARPVPGLFDVIQAARGKTASFYNWEELRDVSRPGSLNASFCLKNCYAPDGVGDIELANLTTSWLRKNPVNFAFVYLGYTDAAGHDFGWMSEKYLQGITIADRCIGQIMSSLPENSTVIITSDHGGHAQSHGTDSDDDMQTPVIINGPGIPKGGIISQTVNITDLAPTVTGILGIKSPLEWIGKGIHFS